MEASLKTPSTEELDLIWDWNSQLFEPVHDCVHHVIGQYATHHPSSPAVCAWDGDFTYSELDSLATKVAQYLSSLPIPRQTNIALLFEKSKWMPVAMLGLIKAGCAAIALDTTQPDARLRAITQQARPAAILCSAKNYERALTLGELEIVQLHNAVEADDQFTVPLRAVDPSDILYVTFTSGTTGVPKGARISHSNVASAIRYQGKQLGFHQRSRVYDFAPYSFDVAWSNFLHTLCAGGCLCIARHEDMVNNLSSSISAFEATLINITPTILRTVEEIPQTLQTVLLSGEMPYQENIAIWAGQVRLLNTYGPSECTFKCAFSVLGPVPTERPDIGKGVGFSTWIVDPLDGNKLVRPGAVGELCLEGPLVGQGYLNDAEKTASAFIKDPTWLKAGSSNSSGRGGLVYKTGDLVKYKPDGRLLFIGRKDGQVKIRGQRVELGDVEYHVQGCLDREVTIVAEVIHPKTIQTPLLALFITVAEADRRTLESPLSALAGKLLSVLPAFMVPSIYIPVGKMPLAATGKVDRRALRELGGGRSWQELVQLQSSILPGSKHHDPSTDAERNLRQAWADVLHLEPSSISTTDSFFQKGGDSVTAMLVVTKLRVFGWSTTVADIIRNSQLSEMALAMAPIQKADEESVPRFSLLSGAKDEEQVREEVSSLCGIESTDIEDVFPCTPLQQGMLALSAKQPNADYVSRTMFNLPPNCDLARFETAWQATVQRISTLSTRIVELYGEGLVQVTTSLPIPLEFLSSLESLDESQFLMGLATPLCRVGIIETGSNAAQFFLEMHHSIFDGWATNLVLDAVENAFNSDSAQNPFTPFQLFVKHLSSLPNDKASEFWKQQLADSEANVFPSPKFHPKTKVEHDHRISGLQWPRTGTTASTLIYAATSILLSAYTNSNDVVFGAVVSGRDASVSGIESMVAPTIATIPVRTHSSRAQTVRELLVQVQEDALKAAKYEQFGLQNIRKISPEVDEASQFELLLVIQPPSQRRKSALFNRSKARSSGLSVFNSHAMMLQCQLGLSGVELNISFDTGAIEKTQVVRFADQFEYVLRQLCSNEGSDVLVGQLPIASSQDFDDIWSWNETVPEPAVRSVHDTITTMATTYSDKVAVSAWDTKLTYGQLDDLSTSLSARIRKNSVVTGDIVVICFEKSAWMLVAMLAVLKAGAIALPISISATPKRIKDLVRLLHPKLVVTSAASEIRQFEEEMLSVLRIDKHLGSDLNQAVQINQTIKLSDGAIVLFTSGSTGTPKGLLWSHSTLASNANALKESFGVGPTSRLFQFASYDFDVATVEMISTLTAGGCLCIPSESDRYNRLAEAIHDTQANFINLTPSVLDTLVPDTVPCLKTVVVAGEKLLEKTTSRWIDHVDAIYNWYGPAEASMATFTRIEKKTWKVGSIGRSLSAATWLVDPHDSDRLAPVGAVAELCIEGAVLADGYVGSSNKTTAFFSPSWLLQGYGNKPGRTGRVYRTGDLVKYDTEGQLLFIGRSVDTERKLRGHRVDLGDIESCVNSFLGRASDIRVVADIFTPSGGTQDVLTLFSSPVSLPVHRLEAHLMSVLPSYMVPKVHIVLEHLPMTSTAKIDRRRLREIASAFTPDQLLKMRPSCEESKKPSTSMELQLRDLWTNVIGVDPEALRVNDNFFRLGGDSISAMRLVAAARTQGIVLTVAEVFEYPQLVSMAEAARFERSIQEVHVAAFSLLSPDVRQSEAIAYAAQDCQVNESSIVDIYPCTPLQEGLLAMTARRPGQYTSRSVLPLQDGIDSERLRVAWNNTVEKLSILRTRIVDFPDQGLMQVVLKAEAMLSEAGCDLKEYLSEDQSATMGLGVPLCRAALIDGDFALTIHHSTYDGVALSRILSELQCSYFEESTKPATPFHHFIKHNLSVNDAAMAAYWKEQLCGPKPRSFPTLPSTTYVPQVNEMLKTTISLTWPRTGSTPAALVRSALALLMARLTRSTTVIYGAVVNGRQGSMQGIENVVGPTISAVPIIASFDWADTVQEFVQRTQDQATKMIAYEQYGLRNIQRAVADTHSSLFQTLLVVQPKDDGLGLYKTSRLFKPRTFASNIDTNGVDPFSTYALTVICQITALGLDVTVSFDDSIINCSDAGRLLLQFERSLYQLCRAKAESKLKDLQTINDEDNDFSWAYTSEQHLEEPEQVSTTRRSQAPSTPNEKTLSQLWSQVLQLNNDIISTDLNFFHIGDSISAMRLAGLARKHGFSLIVADMFRFPRLEEMAKQLTADHTVKEEEIQPFSLLDSPPDVDFAASLCGVTADVIEDIFPCTPMQEGLLALTTKRSGDYVGLDILELAAGVDLIRFKKAWEMVVSALPILRTRIVQLPGHGAVCVVVKNTLGWIEAQSVHDFENQKEIIATGLGDPLMKCALIVGTRTFALQLHHAVYDGFTTPLMFGMLKKLYNEEEVIQPVPFQRFIKHLKEMDPVAETQYWSAQFESLEAPQFPMLPSESYQPKADCQITHTVSDVNWHARDTSPSTTVLAAWAILCSRYSSSTDILFGTISSGRKAPLPGIETIAGPTIAAVPIRVQIDGDTPAAQFVQYVQQQEANMIPYEQTGLSRIRRTSNGAQLACRFQSMLVMQPQEFGANDCDFLLRKKDQGQGQVAAFASYALTMVCTLGPGGVSVQANYDSKIVSQATMERMVNHFGQLILQLSNETAMERSINDLSMATDDELLQIWSWNPKIPVIEDRTVLDLFSDKVQQYPDHIAVDAWDEQFTYLTLDRFSTVIALQLVSMGLKKNMIIPICFEKSGWVPIAMLGVWKAGGVTLMMDPSMPKTRIDLILRDINPELTISSALHAKFACKLAANVVVVDRKAVSVTPNNGCDENSTSLPDVRPEDFLYANFTSGSTGVPKGCLITHRNFVNAVIQQRVAFRLDQKSRVYTFASYTFDMAYADILHGLCNGSTLCIPKEEDRKDNFSNSVYQYRATYLCITPSASRLIDPAASPFLRQLNFGGEVMTREDVARWLPYPEVAITNSYGPCECTCVTTAWDATSAMRADPDTRIYLGKAVGCATWIVDLSSDSRLAPIGTVGELLVEGPLVGAGYISGKDAAAFIENPPWLVQGVPACGISGRRARLYRTGDLVKYDPMDGSIIFVARKDTQIKLRGQRIELADIEHHIRQFFNSTTTSNTMIAVEVIVPKVTGSATLVAFIQCDDSEGNVAALASELVAHLSDQLPTYMVPTMYKFLARLPLNANDKLDRKKLQEVGAGFTLDELNGPISGDAGTHPTTDIECRLQALWAESLDMEAGQLNTNSSFLHYGDSISAMRLATLARNQHIALSVSTILLKPRFAEMVKTIELQPSKPSFQVSKAVPFELASTIHDRESITAYVAQQCRVEESKVEDVFPCTAVQKSLIAVTEKQPGDYILQLLLDLKDDVDADRLRKAWEDVMWYAAPILRCRLVAVPAEGLVQAQIREPITWELGSDLKDYLEYDRNKPMGLGTPLARVAVAGNCCVLTIHHAIYDGHSVRLMLEQVSKAYLGFSRSSVVLNFQSFIKHIRTVDKDQEKEFWRKEFLGAQSTQFPPLPHQNYQANAQSTIQRAIPGIIWPQGDITASNFIRAAWSILAARYTDSSDVAFGILVAGRQAPLPGIESLVAPLIAALPLRVAFDLKKSVQELLEQIQRQSIEMIPYEHTDLLDIRRIDPDCDRGSKFNTLLVVQPAPTVSAGNEDGPFGNASQPRSASHGLAGFNPHALMVMCELTGSSGLSVGISFDSNVIDTAQVGRIAVQFEHVLRQLCASSAMKIQDVEIISQQDLGDLWHWNEKVPEAVHACVHDLVSATARDQPDAPAICAWDGSLSYSELETCSDQLASQLVLLGAAQENIIPLCFEKSMWHAVAALGAMKAGAACVSMDTTQPEGRLRSIVSQVKPSIILASAMNESLAGRLSGSRVLVVDKHLRSASRKTGDAITPDVAPSDVLYVVFTSGSTGTPKGVVTTHENFASAATHQAESLHVQRGTRVYDFVSYSFDVSWSNTLNTLIRGGCLCIPSEWDRRNDIPTSLNRMSANYVYFTPSIAASLDPKSMPGLKVLAMGGEPIPSSEVARWTQCETIIGIYGPAECAQALSITTLTIGTRSKHVGHSFGALTWLVEPDRPDRLAAIGTVGELMIEGPSVSAGYFGDKRKSEAVYITNPAWLAQGVPGFHLGRRGRLYKTGDLLRYNSDGSLTFVGRKDGLIKLRGQRVELSEVEFHVNNMLKDSSQIDGVAAEVITPLNGKSPILAVFVSLKENHAKMNGSEMINDFGSGSMKLEPQAKNDHWQFSLALQGVESRLSAYLPQYMIPGAYILVRKIPMTTTNKTDRRVLREIGNAKLLEDLVVESRLHSHNRETVLTSMEKSLRALWASVLGVETDKIDGDSSFLRIGGESISAMRLVAAARDVGLSLSVADIFKAPRLSQLALRVKQLAQANWITLIDSEPFSLLPTHDANAFIQQHVAPVLHATYNVKDVEDIVPATDFQAQAIADAMQEPPSRWVHWIVDLGEDLDVSRLRWSCEELVRHFDILRAIFIQVAGRHWQVLMADFKPAFELFECDDESMTSSTFVDRVCADDLRTPRRLGTSFIRFMAVRHISGENKLVFRISHAQFDGFSWPHVLKTLSRLYTEGNTRPPVSTFAQYTSWKEARKQASLEYWKSRLITTPPPIWHDCALSRPVAAISDRIHITRTISARHLVSDHDVSPATVFHAACAIALSQQFNLPDVVFGRLVTGRAMLPTALQTVVGPTMTEVPILISISSHPAPSLVSVARALQAQLIEDIKYEAAGMVEIIEHCTYWPEELRDFGMRTAFQQEEEENYDFAGKERTVGVYEREILPRDRLEVYATPVDGRLLLEFEGHCDLIQEDTAQVFFQRLARILGMD